MKILITVLALLSLSACCHYGEHVYTDCVADQAENRWLCGNQQAFQCVNIVNTDKFKCQPSNSSYCPLWGKCADWYNKP